jgi:hypothetical protein
VVVGGHDYDVPGFKYFLNSLPEIDFYIQDLDNISKSRVIDQYDAVLFFNMNRWGKLSVRKDMDEIILQFLHSLGTENQGIFIMHHALLSYREAGRGIWSEICGLRDRELQGFDKNTELNISVKNGEHPVCRDVEPWEMEGERFHLLPPEDHCNLLLEIKNADRTDPFAWVHDYKSARVFACQSGHGSEEWRHPNFRKLFINGINWVSRKV